MRQTEFRVGDRCLFTFNGRENQPVEVVDYYMPQEDCVWVLPEGWEVKSPFLITATLGGRTAFATNIAYLTLVERPSDEDTYGIDISTLI